MELLLGCGASRECRIGVEGRKDWTHLVTLDHNPDHKPDVVHDLEVRPYPFEDDTFDEIHAYEVLEHIGQQGDWRMFFAQFSELWRILKPGGFLVATCPSYRSMLAWGDPSHRRIITSVTLAFLDQEEYQLQVGNTVMSDFRHWYKADFAIAWADLHAEATGGTFGFVLKAMKPSRYSLLTAVPEVVHSLVET